MALYCYWFRALGYAGEAGGIEGKEERFSANLTEKAVRRRRSQHTQNLYESHFSPQARS